MPNMQTPMMAAKEKLPSRQNDQCLISLFWLSKDVPACSVNLAYHIPEQKLTQCLTQLQYKLASERIYTLKQLEDIAEMQGVLCISDHGSIAFPDIGEPALGQEIARALQPSHQFQASLTCQLPV